MKTSKVFRAAKAQLWDGVGGGDWFASGKERFICHAIFDAPKVSDRDKYRARRIVEDLLGPHESLEDWLFSNHQIRAYQATTKTQATRRAWLDHLIAHYESIGD